MNHVKRKCGHSSDAWPLGHGKFSMLLPKVQVRTDEKAKLSQKNVNFHGQRAKPTGHNA